MRPTGTYLLISGITTCHFNAQQPPKLPIGELHLYPKHEILDVAMDTPSPQVLGFLPEVLVLEGLVVRFVSKNDRFGTMIQIIL